MWMSILQFNSKKEKKVREAMIDLFQKTKQNCMRCYHVGERTKYSLQNKKLDNKW